TPAAAARMLREASGLWRGAVADGATLEGESAAVRTRLTELRDAAVEDRGDPPAGAPLEPAHGGALPLRAAERRAAGLPVGAAHARRRTGRRARPAAARPGGRGARPRRGPPPAPARRGAVAGACHPTSDTGRGVLAIGTVSGGRRVAIPAGARAPASRVFRI